MSFLPEAYASIFKDFNAYKIISLFIVLKSTYSDYFIGFIKLNTEFPRS